MSNPLTDAIAPKYRRTVYAVATVVGLALSALEATDGNWREAAVPFFASLVSLLAASNTSAE